MKKYLIVALLVAWIPLLIADDIVLSRDTRPTEIKIVSDRLADRAAPTLVLECHVAKLTADRVETSEGVFTSLSIPRFHTSSTFGHPSLPMMNRLIEVPFDARFEVKVTHGSEQEYSLKELGIEAPLMPLQPSHPKDGSRVPFAYDRTAYTKDAYQQESLASFTEAGVLRHIRLGFLQVAPVAYNPVQGKIKVYNDIRIEIMMPEANLPRTAQIKETYGSPYFSWVKEFVLIPQSLNVAREEFVRAPFYLIVADKMFANDLEPFIQWKIKKGFHVEVGYTDEIGKTTAEIKAYIHNLYNNPTNGNLPPSFVLFVGDHGQVPAFTGSTGSHITDLYYVAVTPGDNLPDILTGRFSANNSGELIPQIEKTLQYEQYTMPDPSFLSRAVMIAGWDSSHAVKWGWPQINYATKYYFNADHGYTGVTKFLSAGSHQNESSILNLAKAGTGYINYTAHGSSTSWADPAFSISNINSLGNAGKYPLVVGNCCLTNKFEITGPCFGEAWLRASGQGAIGYIGGTNSTYWDEDLWWGNGLYSIATTNPQGLPPNKEETGVGAYDAFFTQASMSNSGMMLAGNLAVEESSSSRKKYYWEVYLLMGDPSLMIYLGVPDKMAVSHPAETRGELVVKAVPNAFVSVSQNGKMLGFAVADASGNASIKMPANAKSGKAHVVITRQNYQPYFGTIDVK